MQDSPYERNVPKSPGNGDNAIGEVGKSGTNEFLGYDFLLVFNSNYRPRTYGLGIMATYGANREVRGGGQIPR